MLLASAHKEGFEERQQIDRRKRTGGERERERESEMLHAFSKKFRSGIHFR